MIKKIKKTVEIYKKHDEFINQYNIDLSHFVRAKINEIISNMPKLNIDRFPRHCSHCGKNYTIDTINTDKSMCINCKIETKTSLENFVKWGGTKAEYAKIHQWLRKNYGKADHCELCNVNDPTKRYHWANMSHEYLKDRNDWIQLCPKCHLFYDKNNLDIKHAISQSNHVKNTTTTYI